MARYRKISVQIWSDERFMSMSDRGKLVFLFILTHPNLTSFGAMRASIPGLAAELGWSTEAFREAFREGSSKGMVKVDESHLFICLPKFLKHNKPESPNVVASWCKSIELIPECCAQRLYFKEVVEYTEALGEAFAKALPKDFAKACLNQEQEQEQEQEQDIIPAAPLSPAGDEPKTEAKNGEHFPEAMLAFWNAYPAIGRDRSGKPKVLAEWRRLRLENVAADVMKGLERWKRSKMWLEDGGKFIPGAHRFLKELKFQDHPTGTSSSVSKVTIYGVV